MIGVLTAGWAALSSIGKFVISLFFSAFLSTALSQSMKKPRGQFQFDNLSRGHLINTKSTDAPVRGLYGKCRVGVNWVYAGVSGEDNKYLHLVGGIGEGPIQGFAQVAGVDQLFLDGELWTKWGPDYVYYELYTGTADQNVCAALHAAIPEFTDPMRYTAYLYLRLTYDQDKWLRRPEATLIVEGLKVHDPTAGTTAYSENFALMAYDVMTRPRSRGGMGLDNWHAAPPASPRVNIASVEAARSYCQSEGWTGCALIQDANRFIADHIDDIMRSFRGDILYTGTEYKFKYRDLRYETEVMTLTEADVVSKDGVSTLHVQPGADAQALPNALRAKYYNQEKGYQEDAYLLPDTAAVSNDSGQRTKEVDLLGLTALDKVRSMAGYLLERERWGQAAHGSFLDRVLQLDALDLIKLTHSFWGWEDQYLRVMSGGYDPETSTVVLSLLEEKSALYDKVYNPTTQGQYTVNLPDPTATVPNVVNVSHAEEVYYYRGRSFTRWKIDFEGPSPSAYPWWSHAEIYLKIGAAGDWKYLTTSEGGYLIGSVEEGETYYLKMRSVNIHGVKEAADVAAVVSRTIAGKTAAPANLTSLSATATANMVDLQAAPVPDPDIIGYEVRMGDAWETATFIDLLLEPKVRLIGISPGTKTFWMAAKNNVPKYSGTPVSATATVPYPTNYDYKTDWIWDFTTGTHSNTEHCTNDAEDALKCSHTGGVLTGTWTSPTYDFGSVKRMKIYGDFRTDFSAGGTTWADKFPGGSAWASHLSTGETWLDELVNNWQGAVDAVLEYGETAVDENTFNNFDVNYAEIDARYVRVKATLTDPGASANEYLQELNMTALTYT